MKQVIDTERIPIKLWLDEIDDQTLYQAKNLANFTFAFKHICLMPDAHSLRDAHRRSDGYWME